LPLLETLLPAYKAVGERRYRETSGLYWEDFEPGDVFEHRPGRTVLDVDNTYFTLLTLNIQQVHFDVAYAAKTEWKKMLVDSTFTLALLTGMSVRTVSAKVVANLGWDKVKATHPVFAGTRSMPRARCCISTSPRAGRPRGSSRSRRGASIKTASR
jgi:itaconyl-CoA hydratase